MQPRHRERSTGTTRRGVFAAASILTFVVLGCTVPLGAATGAGAGAATSTTPTPPSTITRSAHIGYLNCRAPNVLLTASIARHSFAAGQPVMYQVTVRNLSKTTCGIFGPGRTPPTIPTAPIAALGLLGPCGELSVVIYDARGTNVYPGPVAFGCPMIVGPTLRPGQSIATTGTWTPTPSRGPGRYRLVIDGKVTLPIVLASTGPTVPSSPPPPPSPLPSTTGPGSQSLPLPSTPAPPSVLPTPTVPSRLRSAS